MATKEKLLTVDCLKILQNAAIEAQWNFEVWWFYKEKANWERFVVTMDDYAGFFQCSIHSHFIAMVISLYRLNEKRHDTVNIQYLVTRIKNERKHAEEDSKFLEDKLSKISPLFKKVRHLRNNLFGHRTNSLTYDEVFMEANISVEDLRNLIELYKQVIDKVSFLWDRSTPLSDISEDVSVTGDVRRLLEDLEGVVKERHQ